METVLKLNLMDVSDREMEQMYTWIKSVMKLDTWYSVKSDKAYETIKKLFMEGLLDFCEFDENETHIRKIDDFFLEE